MQKKASVPDFIVFSDAVLMSMAKQKPRDAEQMRNIPGVSFAKLEKYGVLFIKLINKHCKENLENEKIN